MKLAVLLLSCKGSARTTTFEPEWVGQVMKNVASYFTDQSGGRTNVEFRVFDWFELPHSSDEWNALGFDAGPAVTPVVADGLRQSLTGFTHYALVIDKFDAASAAVSPSHPQYMHVGAQSLDPALLQHEIGHFFGAAHANLDTPTGPAEYGDRFCVMGMEGQKFSYVETALNRTSPNGAVDVSLSDSGPGLAAPTLRACGWLDLSRYGVDISRDLRSSGRAKVKLRALRGAPQGPGGGFCAFADGLLPEQRLLVEYRSREGWDRALPPPAPGWVVVHVTAPQDRSQMSLQVGAAAATPGEVLSTSKGGLQVTVHSSSSEEVDLIIDSFAPVAISRSAPAVASWGPDRIDIFGRGLDDAGFHKAWSGAAWFPSPDGWESIGGAFTNSLAVSAWAAERLDILGIGRDQAMWHKAWDGGWFPGPDGWERLGGRFISAPSVTAWGPNRLDILGLGTDQTVWHKAWDGRSWFPSTNGWESLGGGFVTPPAVASWGTDRLDIFGVGLDKAMYHKAWANRWHPGNSRWEHLGGRFMSAPAASSWGHGRLDIFGIGMDRAMYHKAWDNGWHPSPTEWGSLGGRFLSMPAVHSWGPERLDVFGVGLDGAMYHRAWNPDGWHPGSGWEFLGGGFSSPPTVVSWAPGRLDIFALGRRSALYHKAWDGAWFPSQTDWEPLGGGFK